MHRHVTDWKSIRSLICAALVVALTGTVLLSTEDRSRAAASAILLQKPGHLFAQVEHAGAEERLAEARRAKARRLAEVPARQVTKGKHLGAGVASFYGPGFAGRSTANGEKFNPAGLTAAHRSLPFGSRVRVTNVHNGRSIVVRINDRGPFVGNRVIDLSQGAAEQIGMVQRGTARVELQLLT
jgi:hypothetical protein